MKLLFVTPPYHCGVVEVAGRWVPLQYVYLAGAARRAGYDCVIYDAMSKWHSHKKILQRIRAEEPDVLLMSVITATTPDGIEVLANAKKHLPNLKTIVGGVHAHFMFEEMLEQSHGVVDYIVRGEGEETLVELLDTIRDGGEPGDVKGVAFWDRDRKEAIATPTRHRLADLDVLPTAFDLLDWEDYKYFVVKNSRLGAVSTSRGCSFGCSFCSQQKFWEKTWRARQPEKIVEEILYLNDTFGVNVLLLTDEYPTSDRARWEHFLDLLIAAKRDVYLLMETRVPDIIRDQDILWKYRRAGVVHVYMGVESTDQATLDLMKKDLQVEMSVEALRLVREHKMVTETSLVLGMPDETPESIERTLELSKHFNPDNAHFLAITPWPYADMYRDLAPYIRDHDYRNYNLIEPVVEPKNMTIRQLNEAMVEGYRRFYSWKMQDFVDEPDPFRRYYLLVAAKLIMKSSFIRTKMKGLRPPHAMRGKGSPLTACPAAMDMGEIKGLENESLTALSVSHRWDKAPVATCPHMAGRSGRDPGPG